MTRYRCEDQLEKQLFSDRIQKVWYLSHEHVCGAGKTEEGHRSRVIWQQDISVVHPDGFYLQRHEPGLSIANDNFDGVFKKPRWKLGFVSRPYTSTFKVESLTPFLSPLVNVEFRPYSRAHSERLANRERSTAAMILVADVGIDGCVHDRAHQQDYRLNFSSRGTEQSIWRTHSETLCSVCFQ